MKTVLVLAAAALLVPELAAAQPRRSAAPNAGAPNAAALNLEAEQDLANAQPLAPTWATDMSGLWVVSSSLGGTPVTIDCNVLQIGAVLYGSCLPQTQGALPAPLSGQINGARVSWAYDMQQQGRTSRFEYQANVVSSVALNGALTYGGAPSGFTAARK